MRRNNILWTLTLLPLLSLTSCGSNYSVPTFEKSKGISMIAYAAPTAANCVSGNVEGITEENYQKLKDAGFTHAMALYEGNAAEKDTVEATLTNRYQACEKVSTRACEIAEKVGIKYIPRDWTFYGMASASEYCYNHGVKTLDDYRAAMKYIFPDDCQYVKQAAFGGNFGYDEPLTDDLYRVEYQVQAYMERMEELGATETVPFVNLLPIHAGSITDYNEYLTEYCQGIGKRVGYICYDYYPFLATNGSTMKTTHLVNLQYVAKYARDYGLEMHNFVQTSGDFTGLRDMTNIGDMRLQMYSNLAFGSTAISFFEYGKKAHSTESEFALYDQIDGTYTWLYDACKKVNNEIHAFEDAYLSYSWDNVMFKNASDLYDNANFANLVNPLERHDRVEFKSVERDTLLTTFKHKKTGDDAFMLVNYNDPYTKKNVVPKETTDNTVTLKFKNAKALLMYRLGEKMIVNLPLNGEYTFKLYPGEGRFIIPLK